MRKYNRGGKAADTHAVRKENLRLKEEAKFKDGLGVKRVIASQLRAEEKRNA